MMPSFPPPEQDPPTATVPGGLPQAQPSVVAGHRLSGKASAAWLVLCFVLTAVLIPTALRLPRWVEFEIVLAFWWAIWLVVLTAVLYTGKRVADDYQMPKLCNWFDSDKAKQEQPQKDPDRAWWKGFFGGGDSAALGCLIVIGLVLLIGLVWFLIEVAIPLVLFMLYFVTRGMLARVVNDRHRCHGRLGRAFTWGLVWATVYTAPLAAAVWFVHYVHQKS